MTHETVLAAIQRHATAEGIATVSAAQWREWLTYSHVPPDAPAEDWDAGIARVLIWGASVQRCATGGAAP